MARRDPAASERRFVSEPIEPDPDAFRAGAAGEPLLPTRFTWRGRSYEVAEVERTWKSTDAAHRGPGDAYVRRHWADVRTACGARMRIYGERGGRPRWILHSAKD